MGTERGTTTLPGATGEASTGVRKLEPVAKLPTPPVLKELTAGERRLVRRRVTEPVECMFDPTFLDPASEQTLRARFEGDDEALDASMRQNKNDDSGTDLLSERPTDTEERHRFLWLNYCRYRVQKVIEDNVGRRLTAQAVGELLRWERAAAHAREELVRENVPLVLAMAKRVRLTRVDFAELVSEGNMALLRAVDKFDCNRGYKFSTYACRAILKSFSRVASRSARYRGRFPTEFDPALEKGDQLGHRQSSEEADTVDELRAALQKNLADLTDVEVQVIRARFAMDKPKTNGTTLHHKTLEQVGAMIGVTKERVRQIQNKALGKLRTYLEREDTAL